MAALTTIIRPNLDEYLGSMSATDTTVQSFSFDRMMFDAWQCERNMALLQL